MADFTHTSLQIVYSIPVIGIYKNHITLWRPLKIEVLGRVEMWRGSIRFGLSVGRPFRLAVP